MKYKKLTISCIMSALILGGIGYATYAYSSKTESDEDQSIPVVKKENAVAEVDTIVLHKQVFQKQLLCNGKLVAIRRAELMCPHAGEILKSVTVKNGQRVSAGMLLAVAETRDKRNEVEKAAHDIERAKVELQDKLIGLGYDGDVKKVPADVLHRAEVTSGYYSAKYSMESAKASLSDCQLYAPFSGKIADLVARPHQRGDKFCTLIDDSYFDVEFQVLEAELASVRIGSRVRVSPFIDESISLVGSVIEINPTINERGMVTIKARIKNTSNKLLDGMNVKVIIENSVPDMLVVPKEAVLERDGYHVVFVYDPNKHRAVWTYIDVLYSNIDCFAITDCSKKDSKIHVGDIVITSGNLNLADDTEVKIADN